MNSAALMYHKFRVCGRNFRSMTTNFGWWIVAKRGGPRCLRVMIFVTRRNRLFGWSNPAKMNLSSMHRSGCVRFVRDSYRVLLVTGGRCAAEIQIKKLKRKCWWKCRLGFYYWPSALRAWMAGSLCRPLLMTTRLSPGVRATARLLAMGNKPRVNIALRSRGRVRRLVPTNMRMNELNSRRAE